MLTVKHGLFAVSMKVLALQDSRERVAWVAYETKLGVTEVVSASRSLERAAPSGSSSR